MDVNVGEVLAGKYRVERVIGRGAMGVVVAATHLQLGQNVALKFLTSEALQHPEALARFAREARAAAAIRSEHVARVLDVSTLESGLPYMVMEYLEGSDLARYMQERGPLPIVEAVDLTLQACEALAEAHSLGIIHRDLKPANLFLARYPDRTSLKILDFGISKVLSSEAPASDFDMTRMGQIMGSPSYMSPEQMRSTRSVDTRTDIWALGVVLYELVAGHLPFEAPTMPQLCGVILSDPPPPLRQWRSDVPPRFEALITKCLAKDPRKRFYDVAELALALTDFAPPGSTQSIDRILKMSRTSTGGMAHRPAADGPRSEPMQQSWGHTAQRTRPRGLFGIAFAVAFGVGCATWFFLHRAASWRAGGSAPIAPTAEPSPTRATPQIPAPPPEPTTEAPASSSSGATGVASAPVPSHSAPPRPLKPPPKHIPVAPAPTASPPAPLPTAPAAPTSPARPQPNPLDGRM